MKLGRILPLLLGLLFWGSTSVFAENMQFVDAVGPTGYYVDVDSLSYFQTVEVQPDNTSRTYELVQARVAVVKARTNRRYIYLMQFNRDKRVYHILASKVQAYDTKQTLEESGDQHLDLPFVETSPMQTVVDFIYEQPRTN
ncbi:MAG: hypothetical protein E7203_12375 [Selenomonas ruminantium]|jgi:hypothetical protein|uniref:Uncharacterized protein n=1 Tax=Selenomonas ruminantium TaxID=971 RepID=A0A927WKJ2_SELRU|nr:hypothetical protein [Selenomonas ruminantium]MBE6086221.1 hypothetical protein [Selenomonas ruminantium]